MNANTGLADLGSLFEEAERLALANADSPCRKQDDEAAARRRAIRCEGIDIFDVEEEVESDDEEDEQP